MHPPRRDHAQAALRFALDLHAAAAGVAPAGEAGFSIRVGVHSGPLSSGVVGHLRQRWCIFGGKQAPCIRMPLAPLLCSLVLPSRLADTVIVASRMESSGRPGNVQFSDVTLGLSGLDGAYVPSRNVDIKGKGPMSTYVLEAGSSEAQSARGVLDSAPLIMAGDDEQLDDLADRMSLDAGSDGEDDADSAPLRVFAPPMTQTANSSSGGGGESISSGTARGAEAAGEALAVASRQAHAHAVSALLLGTCGPLGFCTIWLVYLSGGGIAYANAGKALATSFAAALPLLVAAHRRKLPYTLSRPLVLKLCVAACLGCDLIGHALAQQAWCSRIAPGPGCEMSFSGTSTWSWAPRRR